MDQCLLLCNASSARIPWKNKSKFPFFSFFSLFSLFFIIFHHFFPLFFHFLTLILPFLIFGSFFPLYFSLFPFFAHPPFFCAIFCSKFELPTPCDDSHVLFLSFSLSPFLHCICKTLKSLCYRGEGDTSHRPPPFSQLIFQPLSAGLTRK